MKHTRGKDSQMNKGSAPLCLLEIKGVLKLKKKTPQVFELQIQTPNTQFCQHVAIYKTLWPLQEIPRPLCCLSTIIFVPFIDCV